MCKNLHEKQFMSVPTKSTTQESKIQIQKVYTHNLYEKLSNKCKALVNIWYQQIIIIWVQKFQITHITQRF